MKLAGTVSGVDEIILARFVAKDGRIRTIPAKHTMRMGLLEWLSGDFEPGVTYPEVSVNEILLRRHQDYAALRRYLVDHGFLERENNVYWRAAQDAN